MTRVGRWWGQVPTGTGRQTTTREIDVAGVDAQGTLRVAGMCTWTNDRVDFDGLNPQLQETVLPGGVFIGVGPEQHFAHVAATQPAFAFIVDIRRQNLVQHRTYNALFELSSDRADFQSRL